MKKNAVGKPSKALTPTRTALRQGVDRAPRMQTPAVANESALLSERIQDPERHAAQQYKPMVDDILHFGCRDAERAS